MAKPQRRPRQFLKTVRDEVVAFTGQRVRRPEVASGLPALPSNVWPPKYSREALKRLGLLDSNGGDNAFTPPPSIDPPAATAPRPFVAPQPPSAKVPLDAKVAREGQFIRDGRIHLLIQTKQFKVLQINQDYKPSEKEDSDRLEDWLRERRQTWGRQERGGLKAAFVDLPAKYYPTLTHLGLETLDRKPPDFAVIVKRTAYDPAKHPTLPDPVALKGTFGSFIPIGDGIFYLAKYTNLEKTSVDKVKRINLNYAVQLPGIMLDEAIVMLRLQHPNIVRVHRAYLLYSQRERMYSCLTVMDRMRIDCMQLTKRLAANPSFAVNRPGIEATARVVEYDILMALDYLHQRGYGHGDIKPDNILLTVAASRRPAGLMAKLADFGAVTNNPQQIITGTYRYLAPEALYPMIRLPSCDVWGLLASTWEIRTGQVPMSYLKGSKDVTQENADAVLLAITRFLYLWFGGSTNPGDNLRVLLKHTKAELGDLDMTFRAEGPDYDAFFEAHRRENGLVFYEDYKKFFACVMVPAADRRPTAAQLLSAPFADTYFRGIGPHVLRTNTVVPEPQLAEGYAVGDYRSLWYAERDTTHTREDDFVERLLIGTQYTSDTPDELPRHMGPLDLLYPTKTLGPPPSRIKPPRVIDKRHLVAAGDSYYLSRWDGCPEPALVLTVLFPLRLVDNHFEQLRTYAQKCLDLSAVLPSVIPLDEYFIQQTGGHTLVHFIVPDVRWLNLGAAVYAGAERLKTLTAQLAALGFHHKTFNISVSTIFNNLWSNGEQVRFNQALMLRHIMTTEEKVLDFFLTHKKKPDPEAMLRDAEEFIKTNRLNTNIATFKRLMRKSRVLTPAALMSNLAKYDQSFSDNVATRYDLDNAIWADLRARIHAEVGPVPVMNVRRAAGLSRHAPEMHLSTLGCFV